MKHKTTRQLMHLTKYIYPLITDSAQIKSDLRNDEELHTWS